MSCHAKENVARLNLFPLAMPKNILYFTLWFLLLAFLKKAELKQQVIVEDLSIQDIYKKLRDSCVFVATKSRNSSTIELLRNLLHTFRNEPKVVLGTLVEESSFSAEKNSFSWKNDGFSSGSSEQFVLYPRRLGDRKCLLRPPVENLRAQQYSGEKTTTAFLNFINSHCGTHRKLDGSLTRVGNSIKSILENVFRVPENQNNADGEIGKMGSGHEGKVDIGAACERIKMPTKEKFLHNYLFRSKPVIITDAMKHWPALNKWTNEFLTSKYGKKDARVAFAPNGEYEGCENASSYEDLKNFKFPEEVRKQLPFPDLVVVRPAFMNIKFSEFINLLENKSSGIKVNSDISAYLEYTSIPSYFPELEKDIKEMPFVNGLLKRKHLNIWLSDGNTLGKLHFDPFDNFLCQISGKKQVILYEPHDNTRLYEAHIQEAMLGYSPTRKTFRRKKLLDSTSMVMSPINILKPDFDRFPKFHGLKAMNCTISEGDALYMPAFWWHEVQSYPSNKHPRNLAVNYWYEPFFTKEYPCESCQLEVNSFYHHLL